jgi:predicted outer membrane repeat protein
MFSSETTSTYNRIPCAGLVLLICSMIGCYDFQVIDQPDYISGQTSFEVPIGISPYGSNPVLPFVGVMLPLNWSVVDSIPFSGAAAGIFVHSITYSDSMEVLHPSPQDSYWWVAGTSESVLFDQDTIVTLTFQISTNGIMGNYFMTYMCGDFIPHAIGEGGDDTLLPPVVTSGPYPISVDTPLELTVTSSADDGPGSLRQALQDIRNGGMIDFEFDSPTTISIDSQLVLDRDVTILGPIGGDLTLSGLDQSRIFSLGSFRDITISDLNIADGSSDDEGGGGMLIWDMADLITEGSTQLTRLVFVNNRASHGGGLHTYRATVLMDSVCFTGNEADSLGGAISANQSHLNLSGVDVRANDSESCGGLYLDQSTALFDTTDRCNIYGNLAIGDGRDILATECEPIHVAVDTFSVLYPTDIYTTPIGGFTFDIHYGKFQQAEGDVYVHPDGNDVNSGTSWEEPLQTIEAALNQSWGDIENPHTIHLADGLYSSSTTGETFPLHPYSYISIVGETRDGVILDAGGLVQVFILNDDHDVTLQNMSIRNGNAGTANGGGIQITGGSNVNVLDLSIEGCLAKHGGGIFIEEGDETTIQDTEISFNMATDGGGGLHIGHSSPHLKDLHIHHNETEGSGGGLRVYSLSSPIMENLSIEYNYAHDYGGGIDFWASGSPELKDSQVHMNQSGTHPGGGIHVSGSCSLLLERVLITRNDGATQGAGIDHWAAGVLNLVNVTVAYNSGTGHGLHCNQSDVIIVNSLFWANEGDEIHFNDVNTPSTANITFSNIQGGQSGVNTNNNGTLNWMDGNLDQAPLFEDPVGDIFALQEGSPCINAGTAFFVWGDDTVMNLSSDEYVGSGPDIGALESSYIVSTNNSSALPDELTLDQNYPNPFNPTTTFSYGLPEPSAVSITIYDIRGRIIINIDKESQPAGWYDIQWHGLDRRGMQMSTGVYFARLQAGEYSQTIKMLYLK